MPDFFEQVWQHVSSIGKKMTFFRLSQFLFYGFFLFLFIPLRIRLFEIPVFETGTFHPYSSFFLYASDLFFVLTILSLSIWFLQNPADLKRFTAGDRRFFIFWLVFLLISVFSVFFSDYPIASFLHSLRWLELFGVYLLLINHVVPLKRIFYIIIFSMLGEALLAIFQYLKQASVGLSFLGEPTIAPGIPGVAKIIISGTSFLRPYGTFPHPNLLGEFFVFSILFLGFFWKKDPVAYSIVGFVLGLGLIFTFSRVSWLALAVGGIFFLILRGRKVSSKSFLLIVSAFLLFFVAFNLGDVLLERFHANMSNAMSRRVESTMTGLAVLREHPLGVGLGMSTLSLQSVSETKLMPWELQPPYNMFLVVADELGFQGFVLFVVAFFFLGRWIFLERKNHPYFFSFYAAMLVISLFDHSLFTLFGGQALLILLLAFGEEALSFAEKGISA